MHYSKESKSFYHWKLAVGHRDIFPSSSVLTELHMIAYTVRLRKLHNPILMAAV